MNGTVFTLVFQGLAVLAGVVAVSALWPAAFPAAGVMKRLSLPFHRVAGLVTPSGVPQMTYPMVAVFWILVVRLGFYLTMGALNLLPPVPPT